MDKHPKFFSSPSISCILDLVTPALTHELVPSHALRSVRKLAKMLPVVSMAGLECHLTNPDGRTDFAMCFLPIERSLLTSEHSMDFWMTSRSSRVSEWSRVRAFADRCRRGALSQCVREIWLEFDLDKPFAGVPIPSVFMRIARSDAAAYCTIINACIETLLGNPVDASLKRNFSRCVRASHLDCGFHIGMLLGRHTHIIRISLLVKAKSLVDYLRAVEWPGSTSVVSAFITDLESALDSITVSLDIGRSLAPAVGLEMLITPTNVQVLLDYLVAKGLCTDGKRAALARWPGCVEEQSHGTLSPKILKIQCDTLDPSRVVINRRFSHLKLILQSDQTTQAKAYIGFQLQSPSSLGR